MCRARFPGACMHRLGHAYVQVVVSCSQKPHPPVRVDGANFFSIYWNDFMGPLIYLSIPDQYTLALGLAIFKTDLQELGTSWAMLLRASVIFTIPMIIIFFLFQRYFNEGISHTGIKG